MSRLVAGEGDGLYQGESGSDSDADFVPQGSGGVLSPEADEVGQGFEFLSVEEHEQRQIDPRAQQGANMAFVFDEVAPQAPPVQEEPSVPEAPKQPAVPRKAEEAPAAKPRTPNEELRHAARHGDLPRVKRAIFDGAKVDGISSRGFTAFTHACNSGHLNIVQYLLEQRCRQDLRTSSGTTGFFEACRKGHVPIVRHLLQHKSRADLPENNGFLPIYISLQEGHDDVVQLLLTHNHDDGSGLTQQQLALHNDKLRSFRHHVEETREELQRQLRMAMSEMSARAIALDNAMYAERGGGAGVENMRKALHDVEARVKGIQAQISACGDSKNITGAAISKPDMPRLEEWFELADQRFEGKVFGKEGFTDGQITRTSRVPSAGRAQVGDGIVQTKSRGFYRLGTRFCGPVLEHWREVDGTTLVGRIYGHPSLADGSEVSFDRVSASSIHPTVFFSRSGVKVQFGTRRAQDGGWGARFVSDGGGMVVLRHGVQLFGRGGKTNVTSPSCEVNQIEVLTDRAKHTVEVRRLGTHASFLVRGDAAPERMVRFKTYPLHDRDRVVLVENTPEFELQFA